MGFRVDPKQVLKNLSDVKLRVMFAAEKYGQAAAAKLEAEAKRGAPWHDRTGLARQTIAGFCDWHGTALRIGISGNMAYSIYLEKHFEERFAILWPTIHAMQAEILAGMAGIVK